MVMTRILPCLLMRNQGFVKTIRFKDPTYLGDPVNIVKIFNEKEIDEMVVLDITATAENKKPNLALLEAVAGECFVPLGYGGGIRDMDTARALFAMGFEKIVLNSYAAENPGFVTQAAERFGSQSVVVSIDVKKSMFGRYEVYTHAGKRSTGVDPVTYAQKVQALGAGEILLNSIDRDGMGQGYDIALIRSVTDAVNVPVVVCGGASKLDDFSQAVHRGGASAVAAGSMFVFQGKHRAVLITFPKESELREIFPNRRID